MQRQHPAPPTNTNTNYDNKNWSETYVVSHFARDRILSVHNFIVFANLFVDCHAIHRIRAGRAHRRWSCLMQWALCARRYALGWLLNLRILSPSDHKIDPSVSASISHHFSPIPFRSLFSRHFFSLSLGHYSPIIPKWRSLDVYLSMKHTQMVRCQRWKKNHRRCITAAQPEERQRTRHTQKNTNQCDKNAFDQSKCLNRPHTCTRLGITSSGHLVHTASSCARTCEATDQRLTN